MQQVVAFLLTFVGFAITTNIDIQAFDSNEEVFVLTVVITNPNFNDSVLMKIIEGAGQTKSGHGWRKYIMKMPLTNTPIRLQLNPVYTSRYGLNDIVQSTFCSPESRGTNAIMFVADDENGPMRNGNYISKFLASLSDRNGIPTLVWSTSLVQFEESTSDHTLGMIPLAPSIRKHAQSILAFLKTMMRKAKVALIVSKRTAGADFFIDELHLDISKTNDGRRHHAKTHHQRHRSSRFVRVRKLIATEEAVYKELLDIKDHPEIEVIIVYGDPEFTDLVMDEAHVLGMTTGRETWIVAKPSFVHQVPVHYAPGIIAFSYDTSLEAQLRAVQTGIRIWSEAVRRLIVLADQASALKPQVSCTRFVNPKWNFGLIFRRLMLQRYNRMVRLHGAGRLSQLNDVTIWTLGMDRQWKQIGDWSGHTGIVMDSSNRWMRRYHQEHKEQEPVLRVVTLREPPYVIYTDHIANGSCVKPAVKCRLAPAHSINHHSNICCEGFVVDLLVALSKDIGFKFDLFEVADQKWGGLNKMTGKWNGLVASVLNNSADVVATSLKINTERSNAIEFSVPFYQTGITILVKIREGVVSHAAFLMPFSPETWVIVLICLNGVVMAMFYFENFAKFFNKSCEETYHEQVHGRKYLETYWLFDSIWLVLSMFFNAAMKRNYPTSFCGRFMVNIWAFFSLIFMSSFMANLAAFMITKEEWLNFSGLDDMRLKNPYSRNPPWRFTTIPSGATEHIIKSNYPTMYEHMRHYLLEDVDKGVAAVLNGDLDAFIYDASVLDYKAGRDINCQLRTVGNWYAPTGYGFGFPKSSRWLHAFNRKIVQYQNEGYLQRLEDFWLSSFCKERLVGGSQTSSALGLANFQSVYTLLVVLLITCCICFGLEHYYARYCRSYLRRSKTFQNICPKFHEALGVRRLTKLNKIRYLRRCRNPSCRTRRAALGHLLHQRYCKPISRHSVAAGLRFYRQSSVHESMSFAPIKDVLPIAGKFENNAGKTVEAIGDEDEVFTSI